MTLYNGPTGPDLFAEASKQTLVNCWQEIRDTARGKAANLIKKLIVNVTRRKQQKKGRRSEFDSQAVWRIAKSLMKRNGSQHQQQFVLLCTLCNTREIKL
jgi:hypothetical protein